LFFVFVYFGGGGYFSGIGFGSGIGIGIGIGLLGLIRYMDMYMDGGIGKLEIGKWNLL